MRRFRHCLGGVIQQAVAAIILHILSAGFCLRAHMSGDARAPSRLLLLLLSITHFIVYRAFVPGYNLIQFLYRALRECTRRCAVVWALIKLTQKVGDKS